MPARKASAAPDIATLLAENAAAMVAVRSTTIFTHTEPPAAAPPSARKPSAEGVELEALRSENVELRLALEEAHTRCGTIAELERKKTDMHMSLWRAAHDEAAKALEEAQAESAGLREQLESTTADLEQFKRQGHWQQQTAQAELGLLSADARAARLELVGSLDGAHTTSVAGVHLAALRAELADSEAICTEALDALRAKSTFHYTAPRPQAVLHELRQWSGGEQQAPPRPEAASAAGTSKGPAAEVPTAADRQAPQSSAAHERLAQLEQVAEAAAERFETLEKEHTALRRKYLRLKQKHQQQQQRGAHERGASPEPQTPLSEMSPTDRRRRLDDMARQAEAGRAGERHRASSDSA